MTSIVLPVVLDESELRASLSKVSAELMNTTRSLQEAISSFSKALEEAGSKKGEGLSDQTAKAVDNTAKLNTKLLNTAAFLNVAQTAMSGVVELGQRFFATLDSGTRDAQARFDAIQQIKLFKGNLDDVDAVRGKLDDVKNQLEAMSLVSFLSRGGLNSEEIERFAQAINLVAARTGVAKSAVEQMLRAGQLSADALASLGKSQEEVTALITKAEVAAGVPLTNLEKTQVLLRAWGGEISAAENTLGEFGQSNPFDVLKKDIESAWQEAQKGLMPFIKDLNREFKRLLPTIQDTTKKWADGFQSVARFTFDYIIPAVQKAIDVVKVFGGAITGVFQLVTLNWTKANQTFDDTAKKLIDTLGLVKSIQKQIKEEDPDPYGVKESAAMLEQTHKTAMKLRNERLTAEAQEQRQRESFAARRAAQFAAEAAQEQKAAQSAFRVIQRNITATKLQAVAASGALTSGLVSQVANSLQQLRTLELAGASSTKVGKELAVLYRGQVSDAMNRFALTQERTLEGLRGQNALFAEGRQLATLKAQALQEERTLTDSSNQALAARNILMKQGFGKYAAEIGQLDSLWQRLSAIKTARQAVAAEALRQLRIQTDLNKAMESLSFKREELQLKARLEALSLENQALLNHNSLSSLEQVRIANAQRLRDLALDQGTIEARLTSLIEKRKGASAEDQTRLDKEVDSLRTRLSLLQQEEQQVKRNLPLQEQQFSVLGSMLTALKAQAKDFSKTLGETMGKQVFSMLNSIGSAFQGLFSSLIQGEKDAGANFGKALLNALGDMAIAFATTFAGIGAGKIALGDFAGGAGLIAASIALFAAAGLVKGIAAGGANQSSSAPATPRQALPQVQPERREERNTFILVSNRIFGSEEDQARALRDFAQRNQRVVGKIL